MKKRTGKNLIYSTLAFVGLMGVVLLSSNQQIKADGNGSCTIQNSDGEDMITIDNGSTGAIYNSTKGYISEDSGSYSSCLNNHSAIFKCEDGSLTEKTSNYITLNPTEDGKWKIDEYNSEFSGTSCTDICVFKVMKGDGNGGYEFKEFDPNLTLYVDKYYGRSMDDIALHFSCSNGKVSENNNTSGAVTSYGYGYGYGSCTKGKSCILGDSPVYHGEKIYGYKKSEVDPNDEECEGKLFTCYNGEFDGDEDDHDTYEQEKCVKKEDCSIVGIPDIAINTTVVKPIDVMFNGWEKTWYEIPQCEWNCPEHYEKIGNECELDQHIITFKKNNGESDYLITDDYGIGITLPEFNKVGHTFSGWYDGENFVGLNGDSYTIKEDKTLTAIWNINQYKITFKKDNGEADYVISGDYGIDIVAPNNPEKEGYTFLRWDPSVPATMPAGDKTVKAQWKANRYTVTFDSDGGSSVNPVTQDYGTSISSSPETNRVGYEFLGWYNEETEIIFPYSVPAEDKTFTAHWDLKEFTVAFDSKGGTAVEAVEGGYNTYVSEPDEPIWTGHTFLGWYYSGTNNKVYFPIQIPADSITLEAHWSTDEYKISFDANGGIVVPTKTGIYGDKISEEPSTNRKGYSFAGWYKGNDRITFPYTITGDNAFIAIWNINQYKIIFKKNNGEADYVITDDYGTGIVEPDEPLKTGYIFLRWNPSVPATMPAENKTVTAQWKKNRYTVIFDSNGGSSVNPVTDYYETEIAEKETNRVGYEFSGWYDGDTLVTFPYSIPAEDKTLTAQWKILRNTIGFDTDGGTIIESIVGNYNDPVTPPADPIKTGYVFKGWNPKVPSRIPAAGITLIAQWEKNTYKIIFDTDGGNEVNPIEVEFSGDLSGIILPNPVKECNSLSGWNIELPETMPANDITLKAVWNYTCSRSSGGGGGGGGGGNSKTSNVDTHSAADNKDSTVTNKDDTTSDKTIEDKEDNVITDVDTKDDVSAEEKNSSENIASNSQVNESSASSSQDISSVAGYTQEQVEAYSFAKSNGMTTQSTIKEAKMNTDITRIEMAKMLSYYAINVLGKTPDTSKNIKFRDVSSKMDKAYDNGVTLSYQLGIMGINMKNNRFKPNAKVTRAEFITALSRMVYGMEDGKGKIKYYEPHMARLYNEGVVNNTNPIMKEQRGNVMIMIKRIADKAD